MSVISLTGNDTIKLNDRVLSDIADGDTVSITFPNDLVTIKRGKGGNSLYSLNEPGRQADCEIRVIRGSADDKFLNGLLATQKRDLPSFQLMTLDFVKRVGDGQGSVISDVNSLTGGVFTKSIPDVKENVEGDTEQAIALYTLKFTGEARLIG